MVLYVKCYIKMKERGVKVNEKRKNVKKSN